MTGWPSAGETCGARRGWRGVTMGRGRGPYGRGAARGARAAWGQGVWGRAGVVGRAGERTGRRSGRSAGLAREPPGTTAGPGWRNPSSVLSPRRSVRREKMLQFKPIDAICSALGRSTQRRGGSSRYDGCGEVAGASPDRGISCAGTPFWRRPFRGPIPSAGRVSEGCPAEGARGLQIRS